MTLDDYFADLLGDLYFVDEALVVGPYPTEGFFRAFREVRHGRLSGIPLSKLTVLADDGWDYRQLEAIKRLFDEEKSAKPNVTIYRVSATNGQGLVHAKIYFFKLKNAARTYSKRILLVGSANASTQGFGMHAETFVCVDFADIQADEREKLLNYLEALERGSDVDAMWFYLGRKSWTMLPSIKNVTANQRSGFDSWLRRGRLCHKYQVDPAFGRLALRLKRPLGRDVVEKSLNESGFGAEQDAQVFSRNYVKRATLRSDEGRSVWRRRYFIETYYGHWVSAECFDALEAEFVDSRADERKLVIREIKESTPSQRNKWLAEYEAALCRVAESIQSVGTGANGGITDYLEVDGDAVDLAKYRERAEQKLKFDRSRAQDSGFANRFVSGYSFPRVPQLGDEFEDFALDFCQSMLVKLGGRTVSSHLAQVLRIQLGDELAEQPRYLLDQLRNEWDRLCPHIMNYYKDGEFNEW